MHAALLDVNKNSNDQVSDQQNKTKSRGKILSNLETQGSLVVKSIVQAEKFAEPTSNREHHLLHRGGESGCVCMFGGGGRAKKGACPCFPWSIFSLVRTGVPVNPRILTLLLT